MRKRLLKSSVFVGITFMCQAAFGQLNVNTVDITSTKSAYVRSDIDQNYNGNVLDIGTYSVRLIQSYRRAFVEFDIDGENIPANAVVTSATLKIVHNGTVYGSNPWAVKLVKESWDETTVKISDQPEISSLPADESSTYTTSGNTVNLDVTSMVQRMVYEQIDNYGWSVQVKDETVNSRSGAIFYSDDYTTATLRPELEIKYYLPLRITAANIEHESESGASDGSVSFTTADGSSTNYLYNWYDSDGNSVTGGASINNLSAGWYGVKMTGDDGIPEEFYYAFIVGRNCEEIEIEFDPNSNYVDNALNSNLVLAGGFDAADVNYGNDPSFESARDLFGGTEYSTNSYMKFRLWMPTELIINKADITLRGVSHTGSNLTDMDEVSSNWEELGITWNNQPSVNTAISTTLPMSLYASDAVVDMVPFWEEWQTNNTLNYGFRFQLQNFGTYYNYQKYHSPDATSSADFPKIDFKVALWEDECTIQHAHLDYKMDGYYHVMQSGKIRFIYDQQYDTDDLTFNIYDYHDNLIRTEADFSPISTTHGENYLTIDVSTLQDCIGRGFFYLEVITSKNERLYMRFFNDYTLSGCTDSQPDPGENATE